MLAAVVPFALERGLIDVQRDTTTVRVLTQNTGMQCDGTAQTRGGSVRIDGVPGSGAPIAINVLDTAGSVCSAHLGTEMSKFVVAEMRNPLRSDIESPAGIPSLDQHRAG
jgi:4-oxalomesaconate tautomerase